MWLQDGRLQAGDQLLAVNGHSLVGVAQEMYVYYRTLFTDSSLNSVALKMKLMIPLLPSLCP